MLENERISMMRVYATQRKKRKQCDQRILILQLHSLQKHHPSKWNDSKIIIIYSSNLFAFKSLSQDLNNCMWYNSAKNNTTQSHLYRLLCLSVRMYVNPIWHSSFSNKCSDGSMKAKQLLALLGNRQTNQPTDTVRPSHRKVSHNNISKNCEVLNCN